MKTRLTIPNSGNKYYNNRPHGGLSDAVDGYPMIKGLTVLDNCVGWANSRFNEIINDPDLKGIVLPFRYQLVCNAENFIESARRQGLSISSVPVEGGIMVWQKGSTLNSYDGAGHVAVVEEVYEDGSIMTSESGWASWAFKTIRRTNDNGRWGQNSAYKFRGCITNPSITNPKVVPVPPLTIDGIGGAATVRAMQRFFGTPQDGVISGQMKSLSMFYPSLEAIEFGSGGSVCVKKLQKWCDIPQDGVIGEQTVKAWQKKINVTADGIFGKESMKAWQKYLNEHEKAVYPLEKPSNRELVAYFANEFAYKKDTKKANVDGGKPRPSYKTALNTVFPPKVRKSWSKGPRIGASCDVAVATYLRFSGVDKDCPRGVDAAYLAKTKSKYKEVAVTAKTIKDGDIICCDGHICIHYGGKIKEAASGGKALNYQGRYYPKTTNTLTARLKGARVFRVK